MVTYYHVVWKKNNRCSAVRKKRKIEAERGPRGETQPEPPALLFVLFVFLFAEVILNLLSFAHNQNSLPCKTDLEAPPWVSNDVSFQLKGDGGLWSHCVLCPGVGVGRGIFSIATMNQG